MIYEWHCPKCGYIKKSLDIMKGYIYCPKCYNLMNLLRKKI